MQIEIRTDGNIEGDAELVERISSEIDEGLSRFGDRLTRVEVHLRDENADKSGADDIRCMLEARPAGQQPVAVTHRAANVDEAFRGGLRKLHTLLDRNFGRRDDRKGGDTIRQGDER